MAKAWDDRVISRWNSVMYDLCLEHVTINTRYSEVWQGMVTIPIIELYNEAEYWLSCYYEAGNCRCDDRFLGKEEYKIWLSEVGKLKRLIGYLSLFVDYDLTVEGEQT